MTPRPLIFFAVFMLAACGSGTTLRPAGEPSPSGGTPRPVEPTPSPSPEPPPPEPAAESPAQPPELSGNLEIRRIGQWSNTGIAESRRLVIRDNQTWTAFWRELNVGDQPQVDFNRNVVVAVAMGQRSSGGYDIAVQGVSGDSRGVDRRCGRDFPRPYLRDHHGPDPAGGRDRGGGWGGLAELEFPGAKRD